MPRDEREYAAMDREALRGELARVSKELAAWHEALANAKQEHSHVFLDGYADSQGKSVAERRMDGEFMAGKEQRIVFDAQGQVDRYTSLRDMVVVLLAQEQFAKIDGHPETWPVLR